MRERIGKPKPKKKKGVVDGEKEREKKEREKKTEERKPTKGGILKKREKKERERD